MPTTQKKRRGKKPKAQRSRRRGKSVKGHPDRSADDSYPRLVVDGEPQYVLVPIEEYERLAGQSLTAQKPDVFDDPDVKWVDAEEVALRIAADRIAAARKARKMTQKQLAEKLGVPQSQISRIERNPDRTTVRTLKRIAKALNADIRALIS